MLMARFATPVDKNQKVFSRFPIQTFPSTPFPRLSRTFLDTRAANRYDIYAHSKHSIRFLQRTGILIMGIMGKVVGGAIGFALGGPLGAILGATFGHAYDASNQLDRTGFVDSPMSHTESSQFTFFVATFSMLAKLARADGRVSQAEIDTIRQFMIYDLNLPPESQQIAMNIFQTALHSPQSFEEFASQFFGQFHAQPQILQLMMDILYRVSVADGQLNPAEERILATASRIFGIDDSHYRSYGSSAKASDTDRYYTLLGCSRSDSDETIKKQYRKMASDFHPDKIIAKGLPEEFVKFANDKFKDIQEAYEAIKKERGFS
jgi:DnaJ like chaperone protein